MARLDEGRLRERKRRTLVLTQTDNPEADIMFSAWVSNGLNADIVFWACPKPIRALRRLWVDGYLPGAALWYGGWKSRLGQFDTVILHASERMRTVPRWIRSQRPDIRIIYWYWNPVNRQSLPRLAMVPGMECWSFDPVDCERYGMRRNIQYYYAASELERMAPEYDVYFIGHDKGRGDAIRQVQAMLAAAGLTARIDLLKESDANIPYYEAQTRAAKARAILEINQDGQSGYTLRTLESIYLGRKLITNNSLIRREKFYCPENVFVLGVDKDIKSFMEAPLSDVSGYRCDYDIDAWFSGFFE